MRHAHPGRKSKAVRILCNNVVESGNLSSQAWCLVEVEYRAIAVLRDSDQIRSDNPRDFPDKFWILGQVSSHQCDRGDRVWIMDLHLQLGQWSARDLRPLRVESA